MLLPGGALARLQRPSCPPAVDSYTHLELVAALLQRIETSCDDLSTLQQWASVLAMELERTVCQHGDRFSRKCLTDNFILLFSENLLKPSALYGKTIVELGCGSINPLSRLLVFLLLGAERAIGFDLDDIQDPRMAAFCLVRTAAWLLMDPESILGPGCPPAQKLLQQLELLDLQRLDRGDLSGIQNTPLEFRQESLYDMSLEDSSVDVLFSMSFLEHVPDCSGAIAAMYRVMKPGAIAIHAIDGFDHGFYGPKNRHPLDFLTVKRSEPLIRGCNRVRPLEFIHLFEQGGFEVVACQHHGFIDLASLNRQNLAMPFRTMADEMLQVGRINLYLRKL